MKPSLLRVLAYHRVIEPSDKSMPHPSLISASPAVFERQMRHLAECYHVVSPQEIFDAIRADRPLPKDAVLVTFDDAYRDFGEIAWPILRRYQLPATVFVPTAYPSQPERQFWWDRLYQAFYSTDKASLYCEPFGQIPLVPRETRRTNLRRVQQYVKALPHAQAMRLIDYICRELGTGPVLPGSVLNWDELRELSREGATVAAHTRTHPALTQISKEEARVEIRGSLEDVRREIGTVLPVFCYPFGLHDDQVVNVARCEGVQIAVTCLAGQNRIPGTDLLRLQRMNIAQRTNPFLFRLRLRRSISYVDAWRQKWNKYKSDALVEHAASAAGASTAGMV